MVYTFLEKYKVNNLQIDGTKLKDSIIWTRWMNSYPYYFDPQTSSAPLTYVGGHVPEKAMQVVDRRTYMANAKHIGKPTTGTTGTPRLVSERDRGAVAMAADLGFNKFL